MFSDRFWERHSNPVSGYSRLATFPFIYLVLWSRSLRSAGALALWLTLNPILFSAPAGTRNWMSKAVLGERYWTRNDRSGFPLFLSVVMVPLTIASVIAAWKRQFWPMSCFASLVFVLKLWFCDRMVQMYEREKRDSRGAQGCS